MQLSPIVFILLTEIIPDEKHVEKRLNIMFICLHRRDEIVVWETTLTRFLLHKHLIVHLKVVHTPLQTQHLRKERGFHNAILGVELAYLLRQCGVDGIGYMLFLNTRIIMELRPHIYSQHADGIALEEIHHTLFVGMSVGQLVDGLIQQLPGKITQQSGGCGLLWLQFLDELN